MSRTGILISSPKLGIELRAHPFKNYIICSFKVKSLFIYTLTYECIVYIRDSHDPRFKRDLISLKLLRVTRTIVTLVMIIGALDQKRRKVEA